MPKLKAPSADRHFPVQREDIPPAARIARESQVGEPRAKHQLLQVAHPDVKPRLQPGDSMDEDHEMNADREIPQLERGNLRPGQSQIQQLKEGGLRQRRGATVGGDALHRWEESIRFGGMEVAARWINSQRPPGSGGGLLPSGKRQ
jgi:hypothetical protein